MSKSTSNSKAVRIAVTAFASITLAAAGAQAASFIPLGDLVGGDTSSFAYGVSADGNVAVGASSAALDYEAFRWTQVTGMVSLGDLATGGNESGARATDALGNRVVGHGTVTGGAEAFRYDAPTGPMLGNGHLDPAANSLNSISNSVSSDGATIVGNSNSTAGTNGFVWTLLGGMVPLVDFADGPTFSFANDVSYDGNVVVGGGAHFGGPSAYEAAMWVNGGAIQGLGSLAGGDPRSLALGISGDGSTAVGAASSGASAASQAGALEAFRWTSVLSMQGLGDLAGGVFDSAANAASEDGSIIVGRGSAADGDRAFIWTASAGMLDLNSLIAGLLPSGWLLEEAFDVSADGLTIVGRGSNATGHNEGWIVHLDGPPAAVPEPGTALLMALGLGLLAARRRSA